MKFYFENWSAFWAMGAHGFYVWVSYAMVFSVLVFLAVQPAWQLRQLKKQRKTLVQRKQQIVSAEGRLS